MNSTQSQDQPQSQSQLTVRLWTRLGDLVLTWKGNELNVDATLATDKERKKLEKWATKHNLQIRGDLTGKATIVKLHEAPTPEMLRDALRDLVHSEVAEEGTLTFAVNKFGRGKAKILSRSSTREQVDAALEGADRVVKTPQAKGG